MTHAQYCPNCGRETLNGESSLCDVCIENLQDEQLQDGTRTATITSAGYTAIAHLHFNDADARAFAQQLKAARS